MIKGGQRENTESVKPQGNRNRRNRRPRVKGGEAAQMNRRKGQAADKVNLLAPVLRRIRDGRVRVQPGAQGGDGAAAHDNFAAVPETETSSMLPPPPPLAPMTS